MLISSMIGSKYCKVPIAWSLVFASAGVAMVVSVMSVPLWFRGDVVAARSFCLLALEIEAEQAEGAF
jgi:hypothetical protein